MDIATWLKTQMKIRNLNPQGISHGIDVSHVTVGKWVKGIYTPNPENCRKLAHFFNIPDEQVLIIAGHLTPDDSKTTIAEPCTIYLTGPRAHLHTLLDTLTDDQAETLTKFLESLD